MKTSKNQKAFNLLAVEKTGWVTRTNTIVCPYCGVEWPINETITEYAPFDDYECRCIKCEKHFELSCEVDRIYQMTSE